MATEDLRFIVTADTKSFEGGMKRVQKMSSKTNKSIKKQGQTFTQLSYALDDVQYGFRGVQNNLQQIAVQAGLGGPVILGITAMIIALGQLIENWQKFGDEAQLAITKAYAGEQGAIASALVFAEVLKTSEEGTDANTYALKQLKKAGFDPVNQSLEEYIELTKKKILLSAIETAGQKLLQEELTNIIEKQNLIKRFGEGDALAIGEVTLRGVGDPIAGINAINNSISKSRKKISEFTSTMAQEIQTLFGDEGLLGFLTKGKGKGKDAVSDYRSGLKHMLTLAKQAGASKYELAEAELAWLEALDKSKLSSKQQNEVLQKTQELTQGLATGFYDATEASDNWARELQGLFDSLLTKEELFIRDWHIKLSKWLADSKITFEEFQKALDAVDKKAAESSEKTASDALANVEGLVNASIVSIIKGFAEAIAQGDNIGKGLLAGVGAILTQLGGLLIIAGLGIDAFKKSLTTLNGPIAIAAGLAMVAAGAAFTSAAKKAGGGGGGSTGSVTRATPSGNSGGASPLLPQRGGAGDTQLVATVRGQDLRFLLQAADDSYGALS